MLNLDQTWLAWVPGVRLEFAQVVRDHFPALDRNLTEFVPQPIDLTGHTFRVPRGKGDKNILADLHASTEHDHANRLRISTIHGIKGETLDAVLLVSAPSKAGTDDGHWTQWLQDPEAEAARLAYVASSRPRHLLVWAVPDTLGGADEETIRGLGFHIVRMDD